eukprot:3543564-Rhodomonas_salina.3
MSLASGSSFRTGGSYALGTLARAPTIDRTQGYPGTRVPGYPVLIPGTRVNLSLYQCTRPGSITTTISAITYCIS